jgi:CDP-diacylglycerol--glycerol-3-phosphate 3-phosphatidyltransferase
VIVILLNLPGQFFFVLEQILIYASLVLTVVSLADYMVKNWNVLGTER